MAIRRTLFLISTLLAALLLVSPALLHAENAIRFTDAIGQPGEIVEIDMIMENDVVLAGADIPFRWSSPDLALIDVTIFEDRFEGTMVSAVKVLESPPRTSGVVFFPEPDIFSNAFVEPGFGVLATLRFQISATADDQVAIVDSVSAVDLERVAGVHFSDFLGRLVYPQVYPGVIIIGQPPQGNLDPWPLSMDFVLPSNHGNPPPLTLFINSSNGVEFLWDLSWTAPWLLLSPTSGKSPASITVEIDLFGMTEGEYDDQIIIDAPTASNSPLAIPVHLTVEEALPDTSGGVATAFLMQNHPNPFSLYREPLTTIGFNLLKADHVEITIYDAMGRRVRTIFSAQRSAGEGSVDWDGRDAHGNYVASGHYFYRLKTSSEAVARRMIVIK